MNGKFGVTTGGDVYMTGAHVKGNIYADSGTFNGTINTTNMNASGTVTINNANIGSASITNSTLSSCSIDAANINSGTLNSARIPNLSAGKITSGTMSANRISGGKLNMTSNGGGYLRIGEETTHPEVSGINVGGNGVLFGSQAANTNITGDSSVLRLQGATETDIGINGTPKMIQLQTGVIYTHSTLSVQGTVQVGTKSGKSTGTFKVDDIGTGYYLLGFTHGILTTFEDHH